MVKAKLFKVASPLLALALVLLLLPMVAAPQIVSAATDTGNTTVTGNPAAAIDITITGSISDWAFTIGSNSNTTGVDLNVKSNDAWQVEVKDALDNSKPSGTEGKMAEYNTTNTTYEGGKVLQTAMSVNTTSGGTAQSLSGTNAQIVSGATNTTDSGSNYDINLTQSINYGDARLTTTGHVYRIVITFTGTCPV